MSAFNGVNLGQGAGGKQKYDVPCVSVPDNVDVSWTIGRDSVLFILIVFIYCVILHSELVFSQSFFIFIVL